MCVFWSLRSYSSVERLSILLEFRLGDYSIYLAMIGTEINTSVHDSKSDDEMLLEMLLEMCLEMLLKMLLDCCSVVA